MDEKRAQKSTKSWRWTVLPLLSTLLIPAWYLVTRSDILSLTSEPELSLPAAKKAFLATLETSNLAGKWQKKYSSQAQLAGTNMEMVNWTKDKFAEFGLDAWVDNYTTWINYPEDSAVSLLSENEVVYEASLAEDPVDEYSTNFSVPAFLGYAPSGNVTAQYVYCNYGTKEDFAKLEELGVPLEGKIAIVRYGGLLRGLKVKFAYEHGMIGAILYSDPVDDGNILVQNGYKEYPEGPARQPSAIQRGSVLFISEYPGDPLTPGYAIKPGENKTRVESSSTPQIPVIPMSAKDAVPILEKLSGYGPSANQTGFQVGLIDGFDYSVGPNPAYEVNVHSEQNFTIGTMHNIMGTFEGKNKDEVIIIGNHHDSWTYDGGDPHSGTASMLEIIRALGKLVKSGWQPERTIVFVTWDGEEYGLIGSTEFGEYWGDKLKKKVVAYLNMDMSASGPDLNAGASPLLFDIFKQTAKELQYNESLSLYEHFEAVRGGVINNLGSGSDFSVFLDHLGIPSLDMSFGGNENSPVYHYHSIYDNYSWMAKWGDPGFRFHNLMSRFMGLIILNLSETKVIRFTTKPYSERLQGFFSKIVDEIPSTWLATSAFKMCKTDLTVGELVDSVEDKLARLATKSADFDSWTAQLQDQYDQWDDLSYLQRLKLTFSIHRANASLKYYERHFLKEEGLKNRPWYKHIVYASGRFTGYEGQQLPAMGEALEDSDFDEFVENLKYFDRVVSAL